MSIMTERVGEYLRLRRALGFSLVEAGHVLPQFAAYLDAAGAQTLTVELAVAWARLPEGVQAIHWAHRLGAVRGFARWMLSIDPATEIPPTGVFAARQQRRTPHIYTSGEIAALMHAAKRLRPRLRALTYPALLGLLGCTGLRLGEAIALSRSDVDLDGGIITVRHAKLRRERLVPLHPSAIDALGDYTRVRDRLAPTGPAFFVSTGGARLTLAAVDHTFTKLVTAAGLSTGAVTPRVHELRHAVAVQTLIGFYRDADDGGDIDARLPLLSTLLGHVSQASTYWYLTAVPELMHLAAARLTDRLDQVAEAES